MKAIYAVNKSVAVILDRNAVLSGGYFDERRITALRVLKKLGQDFVDLVAKKPFNTGAKAIGVNEDRTV